MVSCHDVGECLVGPAPGMSAKTKMRVAKWYYLAGFVITSVLAWILRDYASEWLNGISAFGTCRDSSATEQCMSQEVALRISFANCCFFALHFVVCFWLKRDTDPRVELHGAFWLWKTVMWAGCIIGFFFVPSNALYGYAQLARVGSGVYLVLQMVLLIDLFYKVNEWLVADESRWRWALLGGGSFVAFGLGLALVGLSYYFYAPAGSCSLNIFFITWTLVIMFAVVGILFLPNRAPTAGLLTSGAVFVYGCFLLYNALNSEPDDYRCVRAVTGSGWVQIVGFFISLATVFYSTASAGSSSHDMFGKGSNYKEDDELLYRADWFHFVFTVASMYIAMLFSNWQVSPSTSEFEIDQGWISTWIKIASKWVCELLYIWTVIAPAVLPDRDFGFS